MTGPKGTVPSFTSENAVVSQMPLVPHTTLDISHSNIQIWPLVINPETARLTNAHTPHVSKAGWHTGCHSGSLGSYVSSGVSV